MIDGRAVKSLWATFQKRHGLTSDGIPGHKTYMKVMELEERLLPPVQETGAPGYSYAEPTSRSGVRRDPNELIPAFADKIENVFVNMRVSGHRPKLAEALRSQARARALSKRGLGIARSMHCYGAAVDIVDEDLGWKATAKFWSDLRKFSEAQGLVTLRRKGKHWDKAHVQALSVRAQPNFRNMTPTRRVEYVTELLS